MEYQEVKEWLDELVRVKKDIASVENLNSNIKAVISPCPEIQIYIGIETIADVMGFNLHETEWNDKKKAYFFIYSNVEFFQIGKSDDKDKV